jgi:pimeloyl-ACP methyl ester carboxylesterase
MAAVAAPTRVRGLVLEMPVLERAAPSVALTFVPLLLALHYASKPAGLLSALARRVPETGFGPLDSIVGATGMDPDQMAAVLHGVLLGPVAPTSEQRAAITAPTLVLGHRADPIHPFSDATKLAGQLPHARLVPAHTPFELRVRPRRLTAEIGDFLDEVWQPAPTGHARQPAGEPAPAPSESYRPG